MLNVATTFCLMQQLSESPFSAIRAFPGSSKCILGLQLSNSGPLIIEILSPSTAKKDRHEKFLLYERHGVKEYWIVHQSEHLVEIFRLNDDGAYDKPAIYDGDDMMPVSLFPGLEIDLGIAFSIQKRD